MSPQPKLSRIKNQRPEDLRLASALSLLQKAMTIAGSLEKALASEGLHLTHLATLYSLYTSSATNPVCQRELAERVGCSTGNMVQVLDTLEKKGFVKRLRDPHDRRYIRVSISPQGIRFLKKLIPRCTRILERFNHILAEGVSLETF
jgi:DNA-binding MarR family transcriptional regulator